MPPIAKRDDQRRNRVTKPADKLYADKPPLPAPPAPENWCQPVHEWYAAIPNSAQSVFYEESDWQMALAAGWLYHEWFNTRRAGTFTEFRFMCSQLMLTEGSRRSVRLEIHRNAKDEDKQGAIAVSDYKARLGVVS